MRIRFSRWPSTDSTERVDERHEEKQAERGGDTQQELEMGDDEQRYRRHRYRNGRCWVSDDDDTSDRRSGLIYIMFDVFAVGAGDGGGGGGNIGAS